MDLADWHMWWKQRGGAGARRVLMDAWDPIGVADVPEAADEYDSYIGPIGSQLRQGATVEEVERYLQFVREKLMGLESPSLRPRDDAAAQRLVDWYSSEMQSLGP